MNGDNKVTVQYKFTDDNPDKGTETIMEYYDAQIESAFTDDNPDKGTETSCKRMKNTKMTNSLQMITPIRGRKH